VKEGSGFVTPHFARNEKRGWAKDLKGLFRQPGEMSLLAFAGVMNEAGLQPLSSLRPVGRKEGFINYRPPLLSSV